jgi:PAS domain S-box-containing protein
MFLSSMMPDSDQSPRHRFQEKRSAEFCAAHLFDLTSDAIYVVDSEDRVTFWNAGAEGLYGWRSDEVIGRSLLGVLKSSPSSTGEMREALRREGHWQGETIHTRRDGTPVDVSSRVCKKGDTHGGNGFVLRIDTDVTARKHAERERANFQSLFEATAGAYLVLQPKDYEIVAASDAYLHATSTNRGIIGRKLFEVFPDAPGDSTADGVRNLAASLKRVEANRCADAMDVQRYPIQVASAEGSTWEERFWNPLNSPVFSATGELVFIVHRVEDVTPFVLAKRGESKGAEAMRILLNRSSHMENEIVRRTQELLAVNERLREAEERFRLLANTIPQLTWMAKPDGWIFWFNQRWYEFTGKTPAEMEGWGWQSVHDPEELPRVMDCWRAALEMEEPWEDTFLLRRHDGELRWHLSRAMPFRDSNNRIVLWFGTNTDITDLVKAEEAARSANRAKDQFIAALSHELRTPLMPVLAVVSYLVKQTAALPRELRGEIEMIQRNVELEARLIDDLLDITRISSGKLELALEITDAHLAVRDAFEICAQDMRNKKLAVELDLKAVDSRVLADPVRLHQVFWNIVNNAVKFTPDNGRIVIRSHNNDRGEFVLEVEDSGIGFEADTLDYIFDAFEQGDRSITRQFGGLGLGLTIAKSLVDAHHGRLEAQSQGKDKGATFRLALNAVTKETEAQTSSCSPSAYSAPLRILVVEDHEDTRRVLANLLREKGHEVFTAANVATGLEILNRQSLDVLLSDIGLPDGNGYQLMERAKALQPLIGISLSGFGMAEDIARAFDAGFAHHLIKPVNFEQLESVLRRVSPRSLFSTPSPQLHHGCHSAAATFLIPEPVRLPRPADS